MMKEGYSHFHVHFSSTVGLLVTAVFPLTMSITFHGPDEFTDPEGFHLARKVNACAFVCAISHFARSQLMRFSHPSQWSKIEVSRLGVDTALYSPRPQRNEPDVFELVCVGRLAPVKAQRVLIEAVTRLAREGYRVRLRIESAHCILITPAFEDDGAFGSELCRAGFERPPIGPIADKS